MFVVIAYDIVDDKKRTKIAKILKNFGDRVQKSVFECDVNDKQFLALKSMIEKKINFNEDSVRYYFLCANCKKNIEVSGLGSVKEYDDVIIV
ncbi:MAG: CRISPR-associated endonuclease Cas2 [Desulfobacterales bacterium]|nr:CRISPR-associated endonuclease Cas2 [Desulfobacterales bacterium]